MRPVVTGVHLRRDLDPAKTDGWIGRDCSVVLSRAVLFHGFAREQKALDMARASSQRISAVEASIVAEAVHTLLEGWDVKLVDEGPVAGCNHEDLLKVDHISFHQREDHTEKAWACSPRRTAAKFQQRCQYSNLPYHESLGNEGQLNEEAAVEVDQKLSSLHSRLVYLRLLQHDSCNCQSSPFSFWIDRTM